MTPLRISSPLPADREALVNRTIGALLAVHRELGSGMSESIYAAAVRIELQSCGIPFESEKRVPVRYRNSLLGHHQLDLLVDSQLVVEIKSVDAIHGAHIAQLVSYLRVAGCRVGLLANFNVPILARGLRRVIR